MTYHDQTVQTVLEAFRSDPERGLEEREVAERLGQHGPNELQEEPPVPAWRRFLTQFQDIMVMLLIGAALISLALWAIEREHAWPYEAFVILAIVILNAVLGYLQESRAEQAVAALRAMSAAEARVVRDGRVQRVPAKELVPGDILALEEGDSIAADARLVQVTELSTLEAALTGESTPVSKDASVAAPDAPVADRHCMVFSGTAVNTGRGRAVVTATGMQTEIGNIAEMLHQPDVEITPLQKELNHTGRLIAIGVCVVAVIVVGTLVLVEEHRTLSTILSALLFGVALAVAAVPEGLAAVITAVLAIGVQRMAKRGAIVRKLPAVETLGAATVIASDKTGTLTRNEMTVKALLLASGHIEVSGAGYSPEGSLRIVGGSQLPPAVSEEATKLLQAATLANNASLERREDGWKLLGDPTEGALLVAARKHGIELKELTARMPRVGEIPFTSSRKRMSSLHQHENRVTLFSKGAVDVLLDLCTHEWREGAAVVLTDSRRHAIRTATEKLAEQAMRTLGVACRDVPSDDKPADSSGSPADREKDLTFLGIACMIDPPREEAIAAVAKARAAGIRPIMITGDHPATARAIAHQLELTEDPRVVTGVELEQMDESTFRAVARDCSVYARVNPEHKLRLVQALKSQNQVVAMTGDGVNDAPALRAADIGVAMGITGTDVAKEASDMVVTDDNFATIVTAVEEGRVIYSNIQKFLRYLLASNTGEVLTIFLGVIFAEWLGLRTQPGEGPLLAVSAAQILWINLITDGPPALALGLDPGPPDIMRRKPRKRGSGVISRVMMLKILFVGVIMAVGTLLVFDSSLPGGLLAGSGSPRYARTMAFQTLVLFQIFNLFHSRSEFRSAFSGFTRNAWLWAAVFLSLGLQVCVVYIPFLATMFDVVPLAAKDWLECVTAASSVLWIGEIMKWIQRMTSRSRHAV